MAQIFNKTRAKKVSYSALRVILAECTPASFAKQTFNLFKQLQNRIGKNYLNSGKQTEKKYIFHSAKSTGY